MSIIKKISLKDNLGTDVVYDIGADAVNVMYDENTSVKDKLDNLNIRYKDSQLQIWDATNEVWVNEIQIDDLTFYVDGTNGDDTNAGTQSSPFKTISKAIGMVGNDAARAATANIMVEDGTYIENINISGKNISISGLQGSSANIIIVGTITASNFAKVYLNKINFNLSTIANGNAIIAKDGALVAVVGGTTITGDGNDTGFYAQDNGVIQVSESSFSNIRNCFSADAGVIRVLNNPVFTSCNTGCVITNGGIIHLKADISSIAGITTPYNIEYANGGRIFKGVSDNMVGATSTTDGAAGAVPKPLIADRDKVLRGDGTWGSVDSGIEISYAEWSQLSQEERDNKDYYIVDVPINSSILPISGLNIDDTPTQYSQNPVTSIGIYNAIEDVKENIEDTIIPTEKSSTSSRNYNVNDELVYNDTVYTVLEPIAVGDNIITTSTPETWAEKSWGETFYGFGSEIWSDGDNIYHSNGSTYVLNKSTSTWSAKTWSGFNNLNGSNIWIDGDNIYYSDTNFENGNYVLDKSTSTWSVKTWSGLIHFDGKHVWSDGINIYYSCADESNPSQYVLDKSTSTWIAKTWNGLTMFNGEHVWTDGVNIYYSFSGDQYVLDKSTSTWTSKTWNGLTEFYGPEVWTDGVNIYYSFPGDQYVLDKSTSTWTSKTWNGLTEFYGHNIWIDGNNIYYSDSNDQYVLNKAIFSNVQATDNLAKQVGNLNGNLTSKYNGSNVPFRFGVDADGNYGYIKAGADTVTPFKTVINLGSGSSFDVSSYPGYKNFTADNFYLVCKSYYGHIEGGSIQSSAWSSGGNYTFASQAYVSSATVNPTPTKTYNAITGILTISNASSSTTTKLHGQTWSGSNYKWNQDNLNIQLNASINYDVLLIY